MIVDIDAQELGHNIGAEVCDELYYTANNGMYRIIKVNLPDSPRSTNGEGVWVVTTAESSIKADDDNDKGSECKAILINDSVYYPNLRYGTIIPFTTNGSKRPYVKYKWLQDQIK